MSYVIPKKLVMNKQYQIKIPKITVKILNKKHEIKNKSLKFEIKQPESSVSARS